MPLNTPEPPAGVPETVRSKLHALADESRFSTPALGRASREQLDVSTPHQVFTIGLDDIESGHGLERAQPVGWRYLVEADGEVIASAETTLAPDGAQELGQFTEGQFVDATAAGSAVRRPGPTSPGGECSRPPARGTARPARSGRATIRPLTGDRQG
jgi:hypothetical protein